LLHVDPGFDAQHLLTLNISLSTTKYAKPQQQIAFFDDLLDRLSQRPGVRSAAISAALPLSWKRITPVLAEGQPEIPLAQRPFVDIEPISPQWFETMHVALRGGRTFNAEDISTAPPVVIVNENFARQYWPGQNAIGKKIVIGRRPEPALVVGVSADVRNRGIEKEPQAELYLPFPQLQWSDMNLLFRTDLPSQDAIGICAALMLTKLLESVLYRTGTRDAATFIAAPILFFAVAALASYLPARRAMMVDPIETLR
jgi:hypothetical protein